MVVQCVLVHGGRSGAWLRSACRVHADDALQRNVHHGAGKHGCAAMTQRNSA
jgi:hypothetical protein